MPMRKPVAAYAWGPRGDTLANEIVLCDDGSCWYWDDGWQEGDPIPGSAREDDLRAADADGRERPR